MQSRAERALALASGSFKRPIIALARRQTSALVNSSMDALNLFRTSRV